MSVTEEGDKVRGPVVDEGAEAVVSPRTRRHRGRVLSAEAASSSQRRRQGAHPAADEDDGHHHIPPRTRR